jgi:hypothetical protein
MRRAGDLVSPRMIRELEGEQDINEVNGSSRAYTAFERLLVGVQTALKYLCLLGALAYLVVRGGTP